MFQKIGTKSNLSFSFEILSTTYAKTLRGTRNANLQLRAILRQMPEAQERCCHSIRR